MIKMEIDFFNFNNDCDIYVQTYSQKAIGWRNGIYHGRKESKDKISPSIGPLRCELTKIEEDCTALEGDKATISPFRYLGGTHLVVAATNSNYQIQVIIRQTQTRPQDYEIFVNNIKNCEFKLSDNRYHLIKFDANIAEEVLDINFQLAGNSQEHHVLLVDSINIAEFKLKPRPLKDKRIYILSDSTAQTYSKNDHPQAGWGQYLPEFVLQHDSITSYHDQHDKNVYSMLYEASGTSIVNQSIGGRSAKSFLQEGWLPAVLGKLRPRDVVLVQWGHNDSNARRPSRYAGPKEFRGYLKKYVASILSRKAHPILVTAPPRYDEILNNAQNEILQLYRQMTIRVAHQYSIPVIDLYRLALQKIKMLQGEQPEILYMYLPKWQYQKFPDGLSDSTHFTNVGAQFIANIIAAELVRIQPKFKYKNLSEEANCVLAAPAKIRVNFDANKLGHLQLTWDHVTNAQYYEVQCKGHSYFVTDNHFNDVVDAVDLRKKYSVRAVNLKAVSEFSSIKATHHFTHIVAANERAVKLQLYEVNRGTYRDKISFSAKIKHSDNFDYYSIVAVNDNQDKNIIDQIALQDLPKRHSYQLKKGQCRYLFVEAYSNTGQKVCSNKVIC